MPPDLSPPDPRLLPPPLPLQVQELKKALHQACPSTGCPAEQAATSSSACACSLNSVHQHLILCLCQCLCQCLLLPLHEIISSTSYTKISFIFQPTTNITISTIYSSPSHKEIIIVFEFSQAYPVYGSLLVPIHGRWLCKGYIPGVPSSSIFSCEYFWSVLQDIIKSLAKPGDVAHDEL